MVLVLPPLFVIVPLNENRITFTGYHVCSRHHDLCKDFTILHWLESDAVVAQDDLPYNLAKGC